MQGQHRVSAADEHYWNDHRHALARLSNTSKYVKEWFQQRWQAAIARYMLAGAHCGGDGSNRPASL
jgi:hypothetical protein